MKGKKKESGEKKQSAKEILKEIVESFQNVENRTTLKPKTESESDKNPEIKKVYNCIICSDPIKQKDYAASLCCCGSVCHVQCLAKFKSQSPLPLCPKCNNTYSESQVLLCYLLSNQINAASK